VKSRKKRIGAQRNAWHPRVPVAARSRRSHDRVNPRLLRRRSHWPRILWHPIRSGPRRRRAACAYSLILSWCTSQFLAQASTLPIFQKTCLDRKYASSVASCATRISSPIGWQRAIHLDCPPLASHRAKGLIRASSGRPRSIRWHGLARPIPKAEPARRRGFRAAAWRAYQIRPLPRTAGSE
jgi:hypothetical protein